MKSDDIIKHFSPAWFTLIMGTGSFANILYLWGKSWLPAQSIGQALGVLNAILFILFIFPWTARWFMHFDVLKKDLDHPVTGNFFATMPLAVIILGSNFALTGGTLFGKSLVTICFIAWIVGAVGSLLFGTYAGYNLMRSENIPPAVSNFSWIIPPVGSMAVPLIGNSLVKMFSVSNPGFAREVLVINLGFFGIGFLLFLLIGGAVFTRLLNHSLPATSFTPTFWIPLGPIGLAALALLGLGETAKALGVIASEDVVSMAATMVWGFGLWFLGVALMITYRNYKKEGIPFSLSWWAFIFPLGAYTMSSLKIAGYHNSGLIYDYTFLLSVILTILWVGVFIKTVKGLLNGSLLKPHAPSKASVVTQAVHAEG